MMRLRLSVHQRVWLALIVLLAVSVVHNLFAADRVLRVCQDPNNLPFSNEHAEGLENKIAELFAQKLGWELTYFSFPQRMGFIRNTLRFKDPGGDYRCDIVMGVPDGYDQVVTTRPYYRSTYALVYAATGKLAGVRRETDLSALSPEALKSLRIGIYDRTPASKWLAKHDLLSQGIPYRMLNADPEAYPGAIIEKDLVEGKIDAAVVWGPIAGYFARKVKQPELRVLPLPSEPGLKLDYAISMGVRFGEAEWKTTVERLISDLQPQINTILADYGVPRVDAEGRSLP
ncbi:MAG: quinoprotein dehydrogenase-associated putative ABC transporter substrate-binding protein [Betaproteobacteria bacterium]